MCGQGATAGCGMSYVLLVLCYYNYVQSNHIENKNIRFPLSTYYFASFDILE